MRQAICSLDVKRTSNEAGPQIRCQSTLYTTDAAFATTKSANAIVGLARGGSTLGQGVGHFPQIHMLPPYFKS